jgi:hypothetical protein
VDEVISSFGTNYAKGSFWVYNTPDGEKAVVGFNVTYLHVLLKHKVKLEIYSPADEKDKTFSKHLLEFTVDMCKFYNGIKLPSIVKLLMQNYLEELNMNLSCPIPKNLPIILANTTYDDHFLQASPKEQKFMIKFWSTALVKKKSNWVNLVTSVIKFRYRKIRMF